MNNGRTRRRKVGSAGRSRDIIIPHIRLPWSPEVSLPGWKVIVDIRPSRLVPIRRACCTGVLAISLALLSYRCDGGAPQASSYQELPASPPAAPPTTPPVPPGTQGVLIRPGESLQAAVDANPPGTTFLIAAGRHRQQTVQPKSGDVFQGQPGAILDGEGVTPHAFDGSNGANQVTIRGLIIENYAPALRSGAIRGSQDDKWTTEGWVVENCEVRHSGTSEGGGMGVRLGHRMVVRNNYLHHNDQYGVGGGGDGVLVEGNEIAYNNYRQLNSPGFGAGGTKFVVTRDLVVRGNYVHDNWGNGIWTDIKNRGALVEDNRVEDNAGQGIFHEIGYEIIIRNNVIKRNGHERGRWAYGAGILIGHSTGAEVYGNVLEDNYNGILGIQQQREDHVLDSLWVHDNTVIQRLGKWAAGVVPGEGNEAVFDRNLRFENNTYVLGPKREYFFWLNEPRTEDEWRMFGQDRGGEFTREGSQ